MAENETKESLDFIRTIIAEDIRTGKHGGKVVSRFPPEPNGYLHIGHAKSISLNFSVAAENKGICHLRFDDSNPCKEEVEYVESIQNDVKWLGFDWQDRMFFASDYFEALYEHAVSLIKMGKAYVCSLSAEEIRRQRGTLTEPGQNSPDRERPIEESLDLFQRMRNGEFKDGEYLLRAKIDMASPNINMRDPAIYRIRHAHHHRTGDAWCIYPMYDFTHCLSDSIEGITHSLCTLEFEDHRPLYDWFLDELKVPCHPQQIEFARLNLTRTIMSKRKLLKLVQDGLVSGWDDPRMPTLAGLRRRGYTPAAIRDFCGRIGIGKRNTTVEMELLEHCLRQDLNKKALRVMGVLNPLKVVIENYPEGEREMLEAVNNPEDPDMGTRPVPFSRELYIERDDFMETPPSKFFRLAPGREVRLRYAYFLKCESVVKDPETGEVTELRCTYDPETRGGAAPDGRKVKATIHWVSAKDAIPAEVRLYDALLKATEETEPEPEAAENVDSNLDDNEIEASREEVPINPDSLKVIADARLEPSLGSAEPGTPYQFERLGYFCVDSADGKPEKPVFNRTVTLKDAWGRMQKQKARQPKQGKQKKKRRRNRKKSGE